MEVPIVKRSIYSAEWYPVYELHRDNEWGLNTEVFIPEDLIHRYAKAYTEFQAVQEILRSLYEEED